IIAENPLGRGGFRSSCFLDSIHGIATGGNPDTLKMGYTSDAGNSWLTTTIDSEGSYETFTSFPNASIAYVGGYDAVYKLDIQELAVNATAPVLTGATLEREDGNLFIVMPHACGGRVRIADALGRVISDEMLSPGGRTLLSNASPGQPKFLFAKVECNGSIQVFKVLN